MTCARCGSEGFGCYECTPDPFAIIARLTADRDAWAAESADNLRKLVAATARIDAMRDDIITMGAQVNSLMRERDTALAQVAGAFEAAALFCDETAAEALDESGEASRILNVWFKGQARAIRALTPADATATLDRIKRQARAEGMRMAYDLSGQYHQITHIRAAILAAAKQEEQEK